MSNRPGQGRKPLPSNVHRLHGTKGAHTGKIAEPQPAADNIEPPPSLSKTAQKHWRAIAGELEASGVLTNMDTLAMRALVDCWGNYLEAHAELVHYGRIEFDDNGMSRVSAFARAYEIARKALHAMMVEFGMTPSSRTRVSIASRISDDADPFAGF